MNRHDTSVIHLSVEAVSWLEGELLGDGCLRGFSATASFTYTSRFIEYIQYVSFTLESFGIKRTGRIYTEYHTVFDCFTYHYASIRYAELLPLYKKWYPNGKKVVPEDINLTPLAMRQWYIGDGQLEARNRHRPRVKLHTMGYTIPDVNRLIGQLNQLGFAATRQPSKNIIYIATDSTGDFLRYIGRSPVECYQYKFDVTCLRDKRSGRQGIAKRNKLGRYEDNDNTRQNKGR